MTVPFYYALRRYILKLIGNMNTMANFDTFDNDVMKAKRIMYICLIRIK